MDLDAIIARRPQIVLVDELAHTNAPGSRHPKRYLDVEELLSHGIDVYTTVNIQHIESLNDVVAQITHVRVRETVPDAVFDRADAVELVDLTPDDLIQRLKEGKVYVPKQAERALEHFFSPANLTALRELALRRTAERVDEQLLTEMQAHAIPGPWAAGERILVCISEDPRAAGLVRYAKRLADRLHGRGWRSMSRARRSLQLSEEERDRIADTLRLAEALGGEAITLPGERPPHRRRRDRLRAGQQRHPDRHRQIGALALVRNPARLGRARSGAPLRQHQRPRHRRRRPCRRADSEEDGAHRRARSSRSIRGPTSLRWLAVAVALGVGELIQPMGRRRERRSGLPDRDGRASRCASGLWPSLLASVAASLCYNFFFLPPIYTFTIADPTNVAAFVLFTLVAVIVSNVAARGRTQAMAANERARTTESLYSFSRKLAGAGTLDDVLWATAYQTALMLKVRVVLLLPEDGIDRGQGRLSAGGYSRRCRSRRREMGVGERPRRPGAAPTRLPGAKRLFLPMHTGRGAIGVIGHRQRQARPAAHAGSAPTARCAARPGRARHRARAAGRGNGPRRARRRNRATAVGAAHLDLA